jgi:PhnB protein
VFFLIPSARDTTVKTVAHLNFRGQARQALAFYQTVFGGELTLVTYEQAKSAEQAADGQDIMWGQVMSADGFHVMAYDVQTTKKWHPGENAFYIAVRGKSVDEVTAYWDQLKENAEIQHPLQPAAWGPAYGMLKDKFDVTWILDVAAE